ncbi:unnamed protein product [Dracunculus medinensis]|uniref:Mitochondrial carrier protein n=1 Tax=Dracunculus medinensis TaxID=318479 RepID=A0A0N4UQJ4_DRAME|nr:unnamed protein product [Dracunculus medinensis]
MSPVENALAGSLASVFAAFVLCPTELIKCKLQAQREVNPDVHSSSFSVFRDLYRDRGFCAFFVGLGPTLMREMPGYFFFFGAYEISRYYFTSPGMKKDDIGLLRTAVSGAIGGMALWTSIFPADVIKSRMQVSGGGNFQSTFMDIIKNNGFRGLYKGLAATLLRTCLASGCLFIAYEESKKLLRDLF